MNDDALRWSGECEILDLHAFFQDWFRGDAEDAAFSRLEATLADDFVIVTPQARSVERSGIIEGVRSQHGCDPRAELAIRRVRLRSVRESIAVFTYEEWQGRYGRPTTGRLSTVVFARRDEAPHGLVWLHVHETWLPE
ncbi:MAG: DUF4440 domain-containing protein [Ectothiorhodospiraceae bacterium]|nr:DUF4440 domain-containing protein [Ectothiorhodospiraceae bacterium]